MFTSLCLTKVLFASTPWAVLKTIVTVGPSLKIRWTAMPIATTAASTGMIQTTEIRARLRGTTVAWGMFARFGSSGMPHLCGPGSGGGPDQARIEDLGRDARPADHRDEEEEGRGRLRRK